MGWRMTGSATKVPLGIECVHRFMTWRSEWGLVRKGVGGKLAQGGGQRIYKLVEFFDHFLGPFWKVFSHFFLTSF